MKKTYGVIELYFKQARNICDRLRFEETSNVAKLEMIHID